MVPTAQAGLNYWVGFLQATGGAINPDKSYWYLLDYKWTGAQWVYRSMEEMPGDLQAPNPSGDVQPLNRYEPHKAAKQLGMLTAPDGNMDAQRAHLLNKAQDFANNIKRQGMLSKNEVWQNMTHTISRIIRSNVLVVHGLLSLR